MQIINQKRSFSSPLIYELQAANLVKKKKKKEKALTEAEDIKKRWQEYIEELYKKIFMTQIIMMV